MIGGVSVVWMRGWVESLWGVLKKTRKPLQGAKSLESLFRSTLSIAEKFQPLGKSLAMASRVTRGAGILLGGFALVDMVKDVRRALDTFSSRTSRGLSLFNLIVHLNSVVSSVAAACKVIRAAVGPSAEKVVQWVHVFDIVNFVVSFLSLWLSAYSTKQAVRLFHRFSAAMKECEQAQTPEEKAAALQSALDVIDSEGVKTLRKRLMLSKKAYRTLEDKLREVGRNISNRSVSGEDVGLIRTLAGRASMQLPFRVASIASDITGIAGSALLLASVPVAGLSVLIISSSISLVSWGAKYFFVNKNPFDGASQSRAGRILASISKAIDAIRRHVQASDPRQLGLPLGGAHG